MTVNDKWERIRKESSVTYYEVMASQIYGGTVRSNKHRHASGSSFEPGVVQIL